MRHFIEQHAISCPEGLYFKGFSSNGVAQFTLTPAEAKVYDSGVGRIDNDLTEIQEQCRKAHSRLNFEKDYITIIKPKRSD